MKLSLQISRWIGLSCAVVGAVVLAAWALDLSFLRQAWPGLAAMSPVTAAGFLLGGGSLFGLTRALDRLERERREREDRIRQINETLEERVLARTSELWELNRRLETEVANRRDAEKALRESETRYRSVTEQLPQLVWTCLPDGRCDYLGPQWVAYTGIPESRQLGFGWAEQLHPDDRERAQAEWMKTSAAGQALDIDFRIRRADGIYRWFKTRAVPLRGEDGRVVRWFGTNTDIEDHRRMQEELRRLGLELERRVEERTADLAREVEERSRAEQALAVERRVLEGVLEAVLAGHWDWDIPAGVEYLSPRFKQMFGYEDHELPNTPDAWQRLILPEDLPAVEERFRRHVASRGAEPFYNEVRYRHRSGAVVWVICAGRVVDWTADGAPLRMVGCHVDITRMKLAQAEIETLERRLTVATEGAGVGVWDWDVANNVLVWNDMMYRLYGLAPSRFNGAVDAWETAVHPDDKEKTLELVRQALAGEGEFNTRFRVRHPNGDIRVIRAHGQVVRAADGAPVRMLGTNWDITDQTTTEENLRSSEERYRLLTEGVKDYAIFMLEPDGRIAGWNAGAERIKGYRIGEVLGRHFSIFYPPEAVAAGEPARMLARAQSHGQAEEEAWRVRKDGTRFLADVVITAVRDGQGRLRGFSKMTRDITERKKAETLLRESRERFERLFENSPDALLIVDPAGRVVQVNAQARTLFRYGADEMVGLEVEALMPGRFRDRHRGHRDGYMENPHARPMGAGLDLHGLCKDGHEFNIDLMLSPMEDGGERRVMAVVRDVTERRRAEAALKVSEERFRNAVQYSAIGMALVSLDGRWMQVNPALCAILGYSETDLLQRTFQDLTHPDDLDDDLEQVAALLSGESTDYQLEKRYFRSDGEVVWAHLSVSLVRGADGQPLHFVSQIQDVTERVQAREDLERVVAELQRSNEDLQQFAYVASHDLQEPLRAVAGCADILRSRYRDKLDPRANELIHYVVDGAQRMQRLIHDLLDYSRVGREELEHEPVELDAVVKIALENLKQSVADASAEIRLAPLPRVLGHQGSLVHLLQNLVGNGIKYRGDRPPVIEVSAESVPDRPMWKVSVKDNGIGIEPRYFQKIFGVFQRLHTRAQYEGTGIGLAICKRIVGAHHGEIWLESEPGRGTTFYFTLPRADLPDGR